MPKKTPQGRIDYLSDSIRRQKIDYATRDVIRDRRTIRSTQRAARELSGEFTATQVAESLGISRQKWVALRTKIEKGEIYGPAVRDLLRDRLQDSRATPSVEHVTEKFQGKEVSGDVTFIPDYTFINKNVKQAQVVKRFKDRDQANKWWLGITGGASYFVISRKRTKRGDWMYVVVDIRTSKERQSHGKLEGKTRAAEILQKYGRSRKS